MTTMSGRKTVAAVPCPHCKYGYSRVIYGSAIEGTYRRRRVCVRCERGFITYETAAKETKS